MNPNTLISIMNIEDLEKIKNVLEEEFDDFWNYSILKNELKNPNATYFVLKNGIEIIGFAGYIKILDTAEITNIVIRKKNRGHGFSKVILQHLTTYCKTQNIKQINLEVNSNNKIAINLYEHFGFSKVGCRKNYYKNGNAILYTKYI